MIGIPERDEAAPYYFRYIDLIDDGNILQVLRTQMEEALSLFSGISEEKSLHRYQPEKWSLRQLLGHVDDFQAVRLSTITMLRNFPAEAWEKRGVASDNSITVRALAFIMAGHVAHHLSVMREKYL